MRYHTSVDYYDYGPLVLLERPLALVGFMASGVRQVAHELSARLGLPLHDIDRMVEHHAGSSLAALHLERGEVVRRVFEKRALTRALGSRPPGVLALGDGALVDSKNRRAARKLATLVWVDRPLPVTRTRLRQAIAHEPGLFPELVVSGVPDDATLEGLYKRREAGYRAAAHRIEAGELHTTRVAERIIELLNLRPEV